MLACQISQVLSPSEPGNRWCDQIALRYCRRPGMGVAPRIYLWNDFMKKRKPAETGGFFDY